MAIYAADIQINVKNKGDLKRLEKRFEKLTKSSVSLEKTLKKLGKRNVVQVDTKAALNAISLLETKIKGLSRTVSVDARTSGGGRISGGGMSGAAMPMIAAAMGGGGGSSRRDTAAFNAKNDLLGISNKASQDLLDRLMIKEKEYTSLVENSSGVINRSRKEQTNALKDLNKHEEIRVPLYEKLNTAVKNQAALNRTNTKGSGGLIDQIKNLGTLATALTTTSFESGFRHQKKHLIDTVKLRNDELKAAKKTHQTNLDDLEVLRKRLEVAKDPSKAMEALSLSERDIDLTKQLNTALATAADKAGTLVSAQSKFTKETAKGGPATKATADGLKQAEEAARRAAAEVNRIHQALAKPPATGLIGGFKSLGKGGMLGALGKGALGATAMIPGMAPFGIGAAAGAVGKSGGAALAGGAMGIAGAGIVTGGIALAGVANQSAKAQAEFKKMKVALEGVTPSFAEYTNALDHVSKLSDKYATSQGDTIKNFTKLQASASASGFTVDEVAEAYEGLQAGVRATGGNQEQLNGVMLAASQIFAKGKVAAEEIRGQISERLPGTMALFAKSMGISGKALDKLLQEGKVTMEDFLNFTRYMKKVHEKTALEMVADSSNAGQRLSKQWNDLVLNLGTVFQPMGAYIQDTISAVLKDMNKIAEKLIEIFNLTNEAKVRDINQQISDKSAKLKAFEVKDIARDAGDIKDNRDSKIRGSLTVGAKENAEKLKLKLDLDRLRAQKDLLTGKIDKQTKPGGKDPLTTEEQKRLANFEKFKKNNKIERDFLNDKFNLGTRQADLNKEIALMVQVHGKENEKAIRAELELRDNLKKKLEGEVLSRGKIIDKIEEYEKRIRELQNPINQLVTLTDAAGDSFQDSFKEVIKGTKSVGDAFVDMFNRIADAYLDMMAEMIANQAKQGFMKFIMSVIPGLGGGIDTMGATPTNTVTSAYGSSTTYYTGGSGTLDFATGGFVDRPTNALIGEAAGEYVIPEHKMSESMSRYQAGVRGKAVIPGSSAAESGGVSGTEIVVSYTGPTLNFNGDDYVPRSAVPEIINSAAKRGARAGEAKVFNNLKNSRSHRARIGL